jgi:hypothetical protein
MKPLPTLRGSLEKIYILMSGIEPLWLLYPTQSLEEHFLGKCVTLREVVVYS